MKKLLTQPVFLFNAVSVFIMTFALFGIAQAASWQDSHAKSIANAPFVACPTSDPWLGKWSSQGPSGITIAPGENQTLYVYFKNIGTSTWYNTGTDKVGLFRADEWDGQNDFDKFDYPDGLSGYYNTRVTLLDSPSSVAPNGLGYFAFRITPKTSTALGTYRINLALGRGGDTGGGPWIETNVSGNTVDCMSRVWYPVVVTLAAPTLSSIANSDGDGNYTVSWSSSTGATRYELQEDDNSAFSNPTTVYNGSSTSYPATDKSAGTYYYHAKACSSSDCSSWSNTRSVTILPEWDATPVGSIVFNVTIDSSGTSPLITPQYRNTGWRTWPVSGADRVILSYRHEDGDQNGDSNWSSITESAFRCSGWPPDNNWWAAYLASATSKGSTGSFPFQFCNTHGVGAGTYRNHFDIAYGSSWFYPGGWVNRITVNITVADSPEADSRLYAGLSATPSSLKQGEALNASYTIKNYGSQSITFNTVTVSCRSPKGVSCDFGPQYNVTLNAGQTYPLNANSSSFGLANDYGTYVLKASYKLPDGSWDDFPTGESGTTTSVDVQVNNPDPAPSDCAQNIVAVTYPDGTEVEAGVTFDKIWQLENCGSTTWGSGYQAVRVEGSFGPAAFNVSGASGLVEIGSEMTAPTTLGLNKATYQLQGPTGFFGPQFWVEIKVVTSLCALNGIDLTISIFRSIAAAERPAYEHILEFFADAVYEMSNGANQICNVTIYQSGINADTANVLWVASEWPCAYPAGYNQVGAHIWMGDVFPFPKPYNALSSDHWAGAGYALGHEWGHYYYGLYDEYRGRVDDASPSFPQTNDRPVPNSVMNWQWSAVGGNFNWLNFSIPKNDTRRTAQFRMYSASGWETLARPTSQDPRLNDLSAATTRTYYPELAQVAPGLNQDSPLELPAGQDQARSALAITWIDGTTNQNTSQTGAGYYGHIQSIPTKTISYPQPAIVVARASKVDLIANTGITAAVQSPDHVLANLRLKDNGVPPDVLADDGLYSGILPYQQNGSHVITVTFNNDTGNAEFTQASAAHSIGPNGETYSPTVQLVGENFSVVVTATVVITNMKADDHGDTVQTATTLLANNVDAPGRIDRAGDVDMFKVTATQPGTLVVRLSNLALGMQPKIRWLKADGTTVIGTFDYQPEADTYFFTRMSAKAGEPFYVKVAHNNSSATTGLYAISAGKPLTDEYFKTFLPLVRK
jgi:hypothetical protein